MTARITIVDLLSQEDLSVSSESDMFGPNRYADVASSPDLMQEIGKLRVIAWEADGERPGASADCGDVWLDEHDSHATHWVVMNNGTVVAAARMCIHQPGNELPDEKSLDGYTAGKFEYPAAFFNRMVVHPAARGKRLSGYLDRIRLDFAKQNDCRTAIIHTHNALRLKQLQAKGWTVLGEATSRFVTKAPDYILAKAI